MHITEFAIKRPITILMLFLLSIMLGMFSFHKLSIDFLPDIDVPKLIVKVEWPGANAGDIEESITQRIEANLTALQNVNKIFSISRDGVAFIHVEFNWGTDMDMAFIQARSRLDRMQEGFPEYAERPVLLRSDPASTPIMIFVVKGDRIENPKSLKDFQEALVELKDVSFDIIKRRLEQIDGIAYTMITGGLEREIKVFLDKDKCSALNISFGEIESALRRFNVRSSGGTVREGYFQYPLRIQAEYQNSDEIYQTPVKTTKNGHIIILRNIARIEDGYKDRTGFTRLNGKEVISLFLFKEAGANTVDTSQKVYKTLAMLYQEYPEFQVRPVFDQAEFIQEAIDNLFQSLFLGGIFAFLILFYFLKDIKNPIIIGIAIPISIITTLIFMYFLDINFNIVSLGGLALGIGLLVDNSIVVLENIMRYKEMGFSLREASIKGTKEVSLAITASTFTTISVFLPLVLMKGLAGELFYDQSVTIVISLTVSLIVSVSLLPMLISRSKTPFFQIKNRWNFDEYHLIPIVLKKKGLIGKLFIAVMWIAENILYTICFLLNKLLFSYVFHFLGYTIQKFQLFFDHTMAFYEKNLIKALNNKSKVLLVVFLLLVISGFITLFLKKELMPPVERKQLVISAELPAGSSLNATTFNLAKLEKTIMEQKGVKQVLSSIGITENVLDQTYRPGVNKAILDLEINDNGKGFDYKSERRKLTSGNGLINIEERCKTIGAELEINTSKKGNTEFIVTVNL